MIDNKKIEDVAKQHSQESYISGYFQASYKQGFIDCAKWMQEEFLKDLWHPASEKPNIKQGECCVTCLIKFKMEVRNYVYISVIQKDGYVMI